MIAIFIEVEAVVLASPAYELFKRPWKRGCALRAAPVDRAGTPARVLVKPPPGRTALLRGRSSIAAARWFSPQPTAIGRPRGIAVCGRSFGMLGRLRCKPAWRGLRVRCGSPARSETARLVCDQVSVQSS